MKVALEPRSPSRVRSVLALAFVALLPACGGGGGGGDDDDDAGGGAIVSGAWHGTTSQGKSLSFTLTGDTLTAARIAYNTSSPFCSSRVSTTLSSLSERIVDRKISGSFTTGFTRPDTVSYTLQFGSTGASASGTITVTGSCGSATGTFSAEPGAWVNSAPVARAGDDRGAVVGQFLTLDGGASDDVDNDSLRARLELQAPAGSKATLPSADTLRPTFTPDVTGTYQLRLVVNDGTADSAPDIILVTVGP